MSRFRHALSLAMIAVIACASFAVAPHAEVARAAGPFVVNTTRDLQGNACGSESMYPTLCSLRQALNAAIAANGNAEIRFNIPTNDNKGPSAMPGFDLSTSTWTIRLGLIDSSLPVSIDEPLPIITKNDVFINGESQATFAGLDASKPLVFIDGADVMSQGGLTVSGASGTRFYRLGIINFSGNPAVPGDLQGVGIELFAATGSEIRGCYIGVNQAGNGAAPNDAAGILIQGGSNNIIGGNNSLNSQFNVVSGNSNDGILIRQTSTGNKIVGNRIGTNTNGTVAIPNGQNGVQIEVLSSSNQIGPPADQPFDDKTFRNTIAGNNGYGVYINGTSGNSVNGNWIGANNFNDIRIPNKFGGILVKSTNSSTASNNTVGGNTESTQNIIAGNNGPGVELIGPNTSANTIANNWIGVGFSNSVPVSNTFGVLIKGGGDNNVVGANGTVITGGTNIVPLPRNNVISGNSQDGVRIEGLSINNPAIGNIVSGNIIGVAPVGSTSQPNTGAGIIAETYVSRTRIGGNGTGEGNRVENNGADGIQITGASIISNTVLGNLVRANIGNGVRVNPATTAMTTTLSNNVIELNGGDGMQIAGAINTTIFSNTIEANGFVGGLGSGTGGTGIQITRGVSTTIDATTVISNALNGLALATSDRAKITNSTINGNGSSTLTNTLSTQLNGIVVAGSNVISITNNTVLSNTLDGVLIGDANFGSKQVRVTDNSISANGSLGINLDPETQGEPGITTYPNHDIDAPFNLRVNQDGLVTGRVLAIKNQPASCLNCLIQVFATNPEKLDGQGKTKYTSSVEISANGYFTTTVGTVPGQLALTATDDKGNTSEFGVFTANYGGLTDTLGLDIGPARAGTAAPSEVISYTHRITNTSNIDYTDLSLSAVSSQGWTTAVAPAAPIALAAGQSKPVTLTLTLPKAPNPSVLAGTIDLTRMTVKSTKAVSATASVTDTTTVASAFKLEVDPMSANGLVLPGKVITYSHTLRNVGNLTGTVVLSASTSPSVGWSTNITPTMITLGPGEENSVNVGIGSPAGAVEGVTAKTTVGIQITDPAGQPPIFLVDTTRVSLQPLVTIVPNNEGEAEAGQTITFRHFVTNNSNGSIKLKLTARKTGLGSIVEFRSATPGVTLGTDGSFTLAKGAQLELLVDITVPERARAGNSDLVTISLSQEDGTLVGSVQDTVKVTANAFLPALYLPLIRK